ncbi:hypothetical protein EW093_00960 [Thiospirochaeta perfilievii]|uniref:Uncharacterized protein n=1 Tax=Thiospirochaeta perfilievii TaxID=252967 RepID=A0A5C1QB02_9SPIO|nr:hypothetical protein [Thiospirochaeta perfilievii]QEN03332.1 hypothetical protein EW093_00960 [Thiospirochaeta perfilievii]
MSDINKDSIDLFKDCLEVLNQITNRKYWSYQEGKESKTYNLAIKVDKEIKRLEIVDGSGGKDE